MPKVEAADNSAGLPGSLLPDKTDWILGGAGVTAQTITDKVAGLTRSSLANGGNGASPILKNAVGASTGRLSQRPVTPA